MRVCAQLEKVRVIYSQKSTFWEDSNATFCTTNLISQQNHGKKQQNEVQAWSPELIEEQQQNSSENSNSSDDYDSSDDELLKETLAYLYYVCG